MMIPVPVSCYDDQRMGQLHVFVGVPETARYFALIG